MILIIIAAGFRGVSGAPTLFIIFALFVGVPAFLFTRRTIKKSTPNKNISLGNPSEPDIESDLES